MENEESDPNKWILSGCALLMSPEWALTKHLILNHLILTIQIILS